MNRPEQPVAPGRARGCLRDVAIVACVLATLILVVGAAAYFAFVMTDHTLQQEDLANLSESEVRADLTELRLSPPDLSGFAYVSDAALDGPRFESMSIGAIRYGTVKDGQLDPTTRTVTCEARWQNASVLVKRPVSAEFEFVSAAEGWKLSIYTLGETTASPLRPLNMYDLEEDVVPLLRLHDAALGAAFADAHVALTSDLTVDGGTVRAVLTKDAGGEVRECTVNLTVSWSDTQGWQIEVASVTGPATLEGLAPVEEEAVAPEPDANAVDGVAELSLACHVGDLVALGGTLSQRDGVFMLETAPIEVSMAGRSWLLDRFVVTGPSEQLTARLRTEVTVEGYLTVGNVLADAPLSLAVKSLS